MQRNNQWIIVITLIMATFVLAACGQASPDTSELPAPAVLEEIDGSDLHRITLTERAAERLGIETMALEEQAIDGSQRLVVPYSAILYDIDGATWVYTSPEPLTFVREAVTIDYVEDDQAVLTDGPEAGTEIVTTGVAELYGADIGVGK